MEWNGVPYDQEMLDRWLERVAAIELDYLWQLRRSFGYDIDPGNKTHLAKVFASLGLEPGQKIRVGSKDPDKNGKAYDSFAYEFIDAAAQTQPRLEPLRKVILLRSLRSKALTPLKEQGINGVYTPTYHQLRSVTDEGEARGVVSGRFSAPYIHQITGKDKYAKKYGGFGEQGETFWPRELFRETDGFWFCADMKQAQYRLAVYCSQAPRLLDMYRNDPMTNFHKMVGVWVKEVRPHTTDTEVKIANFLVLFGGGINATAQFFKCSIGEAQDFRDAYFAALPEMQQTLDTVKWTAESRGFVRSKLGRRSRFPYGEWTDKHGRKQRGRMRTHKGLNCVAQMNEADLVKTKIVEVHRQRKALGFTPRVSLHDEADGRLDDPSMAPRLVELLNVQSIDFSPVPMLWSGDVAVGDQRWSRAK
jgi:hypothetical protein